METESDTAPNEEVCQKTIRLCLENGKRLLSDAGLLKDMGSYQSAYALAKIAQEEFAKALILKFVNSGSLKWTPEVRRSLNHHVSKQLISVILDYLSPSTEDFLQQVKEGNLLIWPKRVADAMNIYIHEILRRWQSKNWDWAEDPEWEKTAKGIYAGAEEKRKHESLYVNIFATGKAASVRDFKEEEVVTEIDRASRFATFVADTNDSVQFQELAQVLEVLNGALG
jgi:AbiV family abortive infection protein